MGGAVGDDEPLMAAGLDSLGAVELRNSLEARLGLQLPGTLVFDYPTAAALREYIASRFVAAARRTAAAASPADMFSAGGVEAMQAGGVAASGGRAALEVAALSSRTAKARLGGGSPHSRIV